ncbi:MAG: NADH-ubiquinone oxidoreductase-F iron-sulfur binding region domain-containing protein [Dehalococcoidales bacterium]
MPEANIVLKNCGVIDPARLDSYLTEGGFEALEKASGAMTPAEVVAEVKASGLRGRGGAGFPVGLKWGFTRQAPAEIKYLICNADEGEVGTFKDRYILQGDPFGLIEAMAIAGYAVGAGRGFIYLRAEYHFLKDKLAGAITQAKEKGLLGGFEIEIYEGAGAYVCGEEMALMESLEGKRGEVRYKPPFPPSRGLWGQPTVINNVETLMSIPRIIKNGAGWFTAIGTEKSKGSKVFSVSGDVGKPGVYELEMGSPLRELVEDLAQAQDTKAVQMGGATGRLLPGAMLDTSLDFENVLGAGSVIVYNSSRDMVDIVHRNLEFLAEESCGKCAPCREGTQLMVVVLKRILAGKAKERDIEFLKELATTMSLTSLCGLGQAAPSTLMDSLHHFEDAYRTRMKDIAGAVT